LTKPIYYGFHLNNVKLTKCVESFVKIKIVPFKKSNFFLSFTLGSLTCKVLFPSAVQPTGSKRAMTQGRRRSKRSQLLGTSAHKRRKDSQPPLIEPQKCCHSQAQTKEQALFTIAFVYVCMHVHVHTRNYIQTALKSSNKRRERAG
jgi:hypothetical protein